MQDVSPRLFGQSSRTFNDEELKAMVAAAHDSGVKVAVHAQTCEAISSVLSLGVDSVEHGCDLYLEPSLVSKFAKSKETTWVPTLSVFYKNARTSDGWGKATQSFQGALRVGMENIACGGDTGAFSHGENALEMKLMVKLGADWRKVLKWATLGGWELIRPMDWEKHADIDRKSVV